MENNKYKLLGKYLIVMRTTKDSKTNEKNKELEEKIYDKKRTKYYGKQLHVIRIENIETGEYEREATRIYFNKIDKIKIDTKIDTEYYINLEYVLSRNIKSDFIGNYKYYDSYGKLMSETWFDENELGGRIIEYEENGMKKCEKNYYRSKLNGIYEEYDETGEIIKQTYYYLGKKLMFM